MKNQTADINKTYAATLKSIIVQQVIKLSKMFLSMMFERSLKSNIDGIEHSLTFDQKKLAFEIMTSAFLFQYILMFGTTKIIFYMINAYPINICIDLDIAQLFFLLLKMFALEKNCVSLKKKKL